MTTALAFQFHKCIRCKAQVTAPLHALPPSGWTGLFLWTLRAGVSSDPALEGELCRFCAGELRKYLGGGGKA